MKDAAYFEALQQDSSDPKYPTDSTRVRGAHADYARGLIQRVRDAASDILLASQMEAVPRRRRSITADQTSIGQIITALDTVERFMHVQEQRNADDAVKGTFPVIDGKGRHLLGQALNKLFLEMKDYYAAEGAGDFEEVELPDFDNVESGGPGLVEAFLAG